MQTSYLCGVSNSLACIAEVFVQYVHCKQWCEPPFDIVLVLAFFFFFFFLGSLDRVRAKSASGFLIRIKAYPAAQKIVIWMYGVVSLWRKKTACDSVSYHWYRMLFLV